MIQARYAIRAAARTLRHLIGNALGRPWAASLDRLRQHWGSLAPGALPAQPVWVVLNGGEVTQTVTMLSLLHREIAPTPLVLVVGNAYAATFAARHLPFLSAIIDAPFDLRPVCLRALRRARPRAVVFIENVYWPVLAAAARSIGIPTILAGGLVQTRFRLHPLFKRAFDLNFFESIDLLIVKSEHDSRTLIDECGVPPDRVRIGGNLKFDIDFLSKRESLTTLTRQSLGPHWESSFVILAGSIHQPEDEVIGRTAKALRDAGHRVRWIVAPRYPEIADAVARELHTHGLSSRRRSQLTGTNGPVAEDVLLIDTFGELAALYALADAVVLGGTFSRRWKTGFGQNIVEPLMSFKPIVHGPFIGQFEDIRDQLRAAWPGTLVEGVDQLVSSLQALIEHPELRDRLAAEARRIVGANAGNAQRHVTTIVNWLQQGTVHQAGDPVQRDAN